MSDEKRIFTATKTSKRTAPFFTVTKDAHKTILGRVEGTDATYCLAVYGATRWLANDERAAGGPVRLLIRDIASKSGCSYRKAADILQTLKSIGVLGVVSEQIVGTKSHAPSVYTFPTLGTGCLPDLRHDMPTPLGTDEPTSRAEISKESKELKEPKPCAPSARARNPLLDTLAAVDGSDPKQVTPMAWGRLAKALSEITAACPDVTATEINRRAERYRTNHPKWTLTAMALAKHWGELTDATPASGSIASRFSAHQIGQLSPAAAEWMGVTKTAPPPPPDDDKPF